MDRMALKQFGGVLLRTGLFHEGAEPGRRVHINLHNAQYSLSE